MPKAAQILVAALLLATTTLAPPAHADWMPLTGAESAPEIAEITVLNDRVRVALEVYVGDIDTFTALVPDDWLKEPTATRPPQAERLRQFASETLRITADGKTLPAELKLAEPRLRKDRNAPFAGMLDPLTQQQIPGPPADKRVLYVELEYPFTGKPGQLTFIPPQDAKGKPLVTFGFIAYHNAVPITDFRYLNQAETLTLDWDDPWYSAFKNPTLTRHHKSALMSFLYVEPREVRHEVLIRVRDLQQWTDLDLPATGLLDSAAQSRIKQRASTFFAAHNPLAIDSMPVQPASVRVEFLDLSLTGVQMIEDERPLDLSAAMLGIILAYPVKQLPQDVTVQWQLFNDRVSQIPATSTDPTGPFPGSIDVDAPIFAWHNYLLTFKDPQVSAVLLDDGHSFHVPLLSLLLLASALAAAALSVRPALRPRRKKMLIGCAVSVVAAALSLRIAVIELANPLAGPPEETVAAQILTDVLANVNSAYVEKDPAALQQALQVVVSAPGLSDVQHELDRALAVRIAGGGTALVNAVKDVSLKNITALDDQQGFRAQAEWTAQASGSHWGHAHLRTIRFRALVELVDEQGAWKLAGITVTDARQEP